MKILLKHPIQLALILAIGLAAFTLSAEAQSATATISGVETGSGNYDYTITLSNTDRYKYYELNGFWYGWTYSGVNIYYSPSSVGNSLCWTKSGCYDAAYGNYY